MARNYFWIFTENKPVQELWKKYNIPDMNWLKKNINLHPLPSSQGSEDMCRWLMLSCVPNLVFFISFINI